MIEDNRVKARRTWEENDYVHILRFRDDKGVEHWSVCDDMTLMRQLGWCRNALRGSP